MNMPQDKAALAEYYEAAESWAEDRHHEGERSRKLAWRVAIAAGVLALLEALALVLLLPLKQVEPIAVLVDRVTGNVQRLDLAKGQSIAPDQALVNSMLAQYVSSREAFNIASLKEDYRKVALWSAGDARSRYVAQMQASNPASPLANLPRSAVIGVEIRSISPLAADSALIRFVTTRTDAGGSPAVQGNWIVVIRYRFTSAEMSAESRLANPLGFQVLRYDRSAEIPPAIPDVQTGSQAGPVGEARSPANPAPTPEAASSTAASGAPRP